MNSQYMPGLGDDGSGDTCEVTYFPRSSGAPRERGNRWFGVTWMRAAAPPHVLFIWLRIGRKRKLEVVYK